MSAPRLHDVIVVGAGPAGATAAALLARRGARVLVLEKDEFPRFHIGESLLPGLAPVLGRLGVAPRADAFVTKRGAEFVDEATGRARAFRFGEALPGCPDVAWHVERSRFDALLRDRAVADGAEVRHGATVESIEIDADRVRVRAGGETLAARYVVDASGQDRLLARLRGTTRHERRFGAAAVYTHFAGLSDAALAEIGPENLIRILLRPDGWGWLIPLPERRLSVGIVGRTGVTPALLETLLAAPLARRLTAGAERLETRVARNYSYRVAQWSAPRAAAIGDAAGFLDPVFSSGVTLALRGAETLADQLAPALAAGTEATFAPDFAGMDRAYRTFAALIERFYHTRFAASVFLGDSEALPLRAGVMSVLAGDVWRHDNPFQDLLLAARRRPRSRART